MMNLGDLIRGPIPPEERRYHIIDLLRGLAAIAILIWHYQHFIALGMAQPGSRGDYPLYIVLRIFYEQGGTAVQLFWIISGFVFSSVYAGRPVSGRTFLVHRVARLYPLHLVTLLVVAGLQLLCQRTFGASLIYHQNNAPNFAWHLIMGSGWGVADTMSFNAPVWSVSAELLIYLLFWILLPHLFRWRLLLPLIAAAAMFPFAGSSAVILCGAYFFIGCAVYAFHRVATPTWQAAAALAAIFMFLALGLRGHLGVGLVFLFAGVTLAAAVLEITPLAGWATRARWIGDNTYGTYLWHIPVQLCLLLGLASFGIDRGIALHTGFLATYLALVMIVARLSYLAIERPCRRAIRSLESGPPTGILPTAGRSLASSGEPDGGGPHDGRDDCGHGIAPAAAALDHHRSGEWR